MPSFVQDLIFVNIPNFQQIKRVHALTAWVLALWENVIANERELKSN
jgi:hypothetical protein